jgi:hypothetical protein
VTKLRKKARDPAMARRLPEVSAELRTDRLRLAGKATVNGQLKLPVGGHEKCP